MNAHWIGLYGGDYPGGWGGLFTAPYIPTEEENRAALKRLGEWWRWREYYRRFDRCCHS